MYPEDTPTAPIGPVSESRLDLSRAHDDTLAGTLPPLALDRQRIVHSAAFRRLLRKTQVFVAVTDDHFRTRMTHTLEVAHLSRILAERLEINSELAEVVALAHDLGHPPFGHAGEQALQTCLQDHGGFEHNRQALRIVEELEHPYPQFRGLNLTRVVRECLAKHRTRYDRPGPHPLQDGRPPPPEGQAVALADRIAYGLHDLQDGLYAGLIDPAGLPAIELWRTASAGTRADVAADPRVGRAGRSEGWRRHLRPTIDRILLALLSDVVKSMRVEGAPTVRLSDRAEQQLAELDHFLSENLYRSERLVSADARSRRMVTALFEAYVNDPQLMPARYAARVAEQDVRRVVADYVAGMTDRYCLRSCRRVAGGSSGRSIGRLGY